MALRCALSAAFATLGAAAHAEFTDIDPKLCKLGGSPEASSWVCEAVGVSDSSSLGLVQRESRHRIAERQGRTAPAAGVAPAAEGALKAETALPAEKAAAHAAAAPAAAGVAAAGAGAAEGPALATQAAAAPAEAAPRQMKNATTAGGALPPLPERSAFPIAWLHIPKCGSSILNALIKIPGACPDVPEDIVISDLTMGMLNTAGFWDRYPPSTACPGAFSTYGSHYGVGNDIWYNLMWKGHGVTMLRSPEQRVISGFIDNRNSWPLTPENPPPWDLMKYKDQLQGCSVKMLTRGGISHEVDVPLNYLAVGPHWGGPCGEGPEPSEAEVQEAKKRLREGFVFVGIQEEWELSMCLFHATFGGSCHGSEFVNSRHLGLKLTYDPDLLLQGWTDPYDGELYRDATSLFWERMSQRGMSVEACQACFEEAGVEFPK